MNHQAKKNKRVLVTGASGFLGRAVCRQLSTGWQVTGFNRSPWPAPCRDMDYVQGSITDPAVVRALMQSCRPDAVIHCAGIAHQKALETDYDRTNHLAVKFLAEAAAKENPAVHFIFLSSISVYGENIGAPPAKETRACRPTSPYAAAKLNAEKSLAELFDNRQINKLDILRIAPVYDACWSLNLEKRVFGPKKLFYVRFGSGKQKMSVLARSNLSDFIQFRLARQPGPRFIETMNICDPRPYTFNEIIDIFKASKNQPNRGTLPLPLGPFFGAVRLAERLGWGGSELLNSHYNKLANDLVFDTGRMRNTDFVCKHSLRSVFSREPTLTCPPEREC